MEQEKVEVLLYLRKNGLDKSGKAPIMGHITLGGSIAQFSYKLSCSPDLWNLRESRVDGKSHEVAEIDGKLENLLLSVQSAYQSLLSKGCLFDAAGMKELFQGSVQTRCTFIERLDMLIREKESHVGIDVKEGTIRDYHSTRTHLQKFIRRKYKAIGLAFSQPTENFIYELRQYFLSECGFQESTFYNAATHLKTIRRLTYREGLTDILLSDKAKISKSDKRLPKALDKEILDKLKALNFEDLEEKVETARDILLFACCIGAAYCDLMELDKSHLMRNDEGSLWLKLNHHKTGVPCRVKLLPEAIRLIEKLHSDGGETLFPCIKYKNYQIYLKALRFRAGISSPFITRMTGRTFATLITFEQGVPIETVSKTLGCSNIGITERYTKVTPQELFGEFNRFLSLTEDIQMSIQQQTY